MRGCYGPRTRLPWTKPTPRSSESAPSCCLPPEPRLRQVRRPGVLLRRPSRVAYTATPKAFDPTRLATCRLSRGQWGKPGANGLLTDSTMASERRLPQDTNSCMVRALNTGHGPMGKCSHGSRYLSCNPGVPSTLAWLALRSRDAVERAEELPRPGVVRVRQRLAHAKKPWP